MACYSDNNCPHYECDKNIDADVLTAIAAHNNFEEVNGEQESDDNSSDSSDYGNIYGGSAYIPPRPPKKLALFYDALPKCLPLTIGFNTEGQRWDKIPCPCSRTIQG